MSWNIAGADVTPTNDQMNRLDQISVLAGRFGAILTTPMIWHMVIRAADAPAKGHPTQSPKEARHKAGA